jgi:RNA polymerase sigma-70 factor (ECF subfamily)
MEGEQARGQIKGMTGKSELASAWANSDAMSGAHDPVQELAWVAASQKGDGLAFNRLVLKWEQTIYNVALRMLHNRDEAMEASQEVFLLAFKNIRRFRQDAKFSTWLYRIAVNHCSSRVRQRPPGSHISLDNDEPGVKAPQQLKVGQNQEGDLLRAENRSRVHAALAYLPADQRAIIELKFFQELTFEDIAAILEAPLSTIKSRLYAGLELLKVRLSAKT